MRLTSGEDLGTLHGHARGRTALTARFAPYATSFNDWFVSGLGQGIVLSTFFGHGLQLHGIENRSNRLPLRAPNASKSFVCRSTKALDCCSRIANREDSVSSFDSMAFQQSTAAICDSILQKQSVQIGHDMCYDTYTYTRPRAVSLTQKHVKGSSLVTF